MDVLTWQVCIQYVDVLQAFQEESRIDGNGAAVKYTLFVPTGYYDQYFEQQSPCRKEDSWLVHITQDFLIADQQRR